MDISIADVDDSNVDQLAHLIKELAKFEHLDPPTDEAIARLKRDLGSEHPYLFAHLAMAEGEPVGYACYYFTYSTFLAGPPCSWRTSSYWTATAGMARAAVCWSTASRWRRRRSAEGWNGTFSIGTPTP